MSLHVNMRIDGKYINTNMTNQNFTINTGRDNNLMHKKSDQLGYHVGIFFFKIKLNINNCMPHLVHCRSYHLKS